jgi:hypothetical protein
MPYCITLRSRSDATIAGWYDGSAGRWSTDHTRQKVFDTKRAAGSACQDLRSLCPRNAEVINIEKVLKNSAQHGQLEERRVRLSMKDDVVGHPYVGVAVICQNRVAAVGVAGTSREIAAGHVDLEPMAGTKRVTDVTEIDG